MKHQGQTTSETMSICSFCSLTSLSGNAGILNQIEPPRRQKAWGMNSPTISISGGLAQASFAYHGGSWPVRCIEGLGDLRLLLPTCLRYCLANSRRLLLLALKFQSTRKLLEHYFRRRLQTISGLAHYVDRVGQPLERIVILLKLGFDLSEMKQVHRDFRMNIPSQALTYCDGVLAKTQGLFKVSL